MAHAINVFFFDYVHSSGTSVSSSCSRLLYASRLLASLVAVPTELMAHAIDMFSFLFMSVLRKTPASSCLFTLVRCMTLTRCRLSDYMLVALPTELMAHAISVFFFDYVHSSGISASSICSRLLYASRLLASLVALPTELPPMLQELLRKIKNGWAARIRT